MTKISARLVLAMLLVLQPVVQAAELSPVDILLTRAIPQDEAALATAGPEKGERLAILQSDLALVVEGLEGFASEEDAAPSLKRLRESVDAPEQFKDRASALDAVYRALAVVDYTWAKRLPEAPCSPDAHRAALLKSGALSSWISSLLGVDADAATALDRASASTKASAREYALMRAKIHRLSEALGSEKAIGTMRASLYCRRAGAYEALSAANRSSGLTAASHATGADDITGVYVLARAGTDGWEILGAATSIDGAIVTDARLVDSEGLALLRRDGKKPIRVTVERRDSGLALLRASEPVKGLSLAENAPAKDDLIEALGHPERTGAWTRTRGLVTSADALSFQSDAVVDVGMAGGAALTEDGKLAGVFVLRRAQSGDEAFDWPVAVSAPALKSWLAGGALTAPSGSVEITEAGTASILTALRPMGVSTLASSNVVWINQNEFYQDGVRAVCAANCDDPAPAPAPRARSRTRYTNPRSSYGSRSNANANAELGKALGEAVAPLVEAMIFKGIPALFRGIGSLFKSKPKSQETKIAPPPLAHPPKPECNLTKSSAPAKAGSDPFEVAVRLSCTGDNVQLSGHLVTFTFEWDGKASSETISVATEPNGVAALTIQVANREIAVHKVRVAADRSLDDLDKYDPDKRDSEELAEIAASSPGGEPSLGPLEAAAATAPKQEPVAALATGAVATTAGRKLVLGGRGKVLRVIVKLAPKALGPLVVIVTVKQVFDIGWSVGSVAEGKISEVQWGLRQYDRQPQELSPRDNLQSEADRDTGRCTKTQHGELQTEVDSECTQDVECRGPRNDELKDCDALRRLLRRNHDSLRQRQRCLRARQKIRNQCFPEARPENPNDRYAAHRQASEDVLRGSVNCKDKIALVREQMEKLLCP